MDFPIVTNVSVNASGDTIYSAWLTRLDVPRAAISGSSTVIARIRPQIHYGALPGVYGYFYNNGLDWGNWSGYEVGLARNGNGTSGTSGTNLILGICIAHSSYYFGNLTLVTNEWYDVAFIVNDAGKDAEGHDLTDSVTAVLCSKAHGFKSQTQNISTNAYTTYKTYGQIRIGGEGGYSAPVDYYNATTKAAINNANGTKSFNGQIHQVAVWDRALTLDEVAAAFGHPNNMVMGVGIADGTSDEFAADGEGSRDWTLNEAWHDMAASVDAAHPDLTIRFTPAANNVGHGEPEGRADAEGERLDSRLRQGGRLQRGSVGDDGEARSQKRREHAHDHLQGRPGGVRRDRQGGDQRLVAGGGGQRKQL